MLRVGKDADKLEPELYCRCLSIKFQTFDFQMLFRNMLYRKVGVLLQNKIPEFQAT